MGFIYSVVATVVICLVLHIAIFRSIKAIRCKDDIWSASYIPIATGLIIIWNRLVAF
jgi:hypothetical protein